MCLEYLQRNHAQLTLFNNVQLPLIRKEARFRRALGEQRTWKSPGSHLEASEEVRGLITADPNLRSLLSNRDSNTDPEPVRRPNSWFTAELLLCLGSKSTGLVMLARLLRHTTPDSPRHELALSPRAIKGWTGKLR